MTDKGWRSWYDELNCLVKEMTPMGRETVYSYDAAGKGTAVGVAAGA